METTLALINNTGYGASELKKSYQASTLRSFIIALSIHLCVIIAYLFISYINKVNAKEIPNNPHEPPIFVETDLINQNDERKLTEVKHENVVKPEKDLASLEPVAVTKNLSDKVVLKTQNELNNLQNTTSRNGDSNSLATNNTTKVENGVIDKNIIKQIEQVKQTYQSFEVEKVPVCINLMQVRSIINYPAIAKEIGTEGNVSIKVLVDESGNVIGTGKLTGPDVFYNEVKEKSQELKFTPGLQNNNPVKVWITVPFIFKLKN